MTDKTTHALILALVSFMISPTAQSAESEDVFLLPYFLGNGETGAFRPQPGRSEVRMAE